VLVFQLFISSLILSPFTVSANMGLGGLVAIMLAIGSKVVGSNLAEDDGF
jgi:hypothetical protein